MSVVAVNGLKKHYQIYKKQAGMLAAWRSLIKREYYNVYAVDDISFTIEAGELVGFIGPNGAGKTTTLKCLSGLLYPDGGKITVLGFTPFMRKDEFLKQISLVMGQKNQLWWDLPAMDSLVLNKEIYEIPDKQFKQTTAQLIELLDMRALINVPVRKLSLGERMKAELIAALIHKPQVLFLDEPTIGLDVIMQKKIRDFIKEYNQLYKTTIILTSHYMNDVQKLCKRVIIIDKGKLLYDGKLAKVVEQFAGNKLITIILKDRLKKQALEKIGKLRNYHFPRAEFTVPRKETSSFAVKLITTFPIEDLNIQDPPIEEIIRGIFTGKRL